MPLWYRFLSLSGSWGLRQRFLSLESFWGSRYPFSLALQSVFSLLLLGSLRGDFLYLCWALWLCGVVFSLPNDSSLPLGNGSFPLRQSPALPKEEAANRPDKTNRCSGKTERRFFHCLCGIVFYLCRAPWGLRYRFSLALQRGAFPCPPFIRQGFPVRSGNRPAPSLFARLHSRYTSSLHTSHTR